MTRKLNYGEPKPTQMTLTIAERSITYPYGVLKDILVRVKVLLFPIDFVIRDMLQNSETPLLLERLFLKTGKNLIDVVLGELILRFHDEKFVLNVFEAMKHHKENP